MSRHVIDCDAPVFLPHGWEDPGVFDQLPNRVKGQIVFNPKKIALFWAKGQRTSLVNGYDIKKQLADRPVLDANVLDYLLAHQEVIPEESKDDNTYFWGTIYRRFDPFFRSWFPLVRYLCWKDSLWRWGATELHDDFPPNSPAILLDS